MCRTTTSAGLLVCGAMLTGCTVETTPRHGETGESDPKEENEGVLRTFDVQLSSDTTEETVIPRIVTAGREEISAACEGTSSAAIRVFKPLHIGRGLGSDEFSPEDHRYCSVRFVAPPYVPEPISTSAAFGDT